MKTIFGLIIGLIIMILFYLLIGQILEVIGPYLQKIFIAIAIIPGVTIGIIFLFSIFSKKKDK